MKFQKYDNTHLSWLVGIHVTFLGSLLVVVVADRLSEPTEHPNGSRKGQSRK
jgi:hypothetical protein